MTTKSPENISQSSESYYALCIAVQTMKARCTSLQNRLSAVEEENHGLKTRHLAPDRDEPISDGEQEVRVLRNKIVDLNRQKNQLSDHISIVANENFQLWSRLSKLTKENLLTVGDSDNIQLSESDKDRQLLIRSKTFTRNSPNTNIRRRNSQTDENLSLEEVSLKLLGTVDLEPKSPEAINAGFERSLLFPFPSDEQKQSLDSDSQNFEKALQKVRTELLHQQNKLNGSLKNVQIWKNQEICSGCQKKAVTKLDKMTLSAEMDISSLTMEKELKLGRRKIDLLEQKRIADDLDKTCPMCGKIFTNIIFEDFLSHVESHLLENNDGDGDGNVEEQEREVEALFEKLSHVSGNF